MAELPNLLNPYAPAANTQQSLGQLGNDVGDLRGRLDLDRPVHPAIVRGLMQIMGGGDPQHAAVNTRLAMQHPDLADHIFSQPHPGQSAQFSGGAVPGAPQAPGLASATAQPEQGISNSENTSPEQDQAALMTPDEQAQNQTTPNRVRQLTVSHPSLGDSPMQMSLDSGGERPFTRRDLQDFASVQGTLATPMRLEANQRRLEERLNSVESVAAAGRISREGIAANTETGKNDRAAQMISVKRDAMKQQHDKDLNDIAAAMARVRMAKDQDAQIQAAHDATTLIANVENNRSKFVSSDISLMATPEGRALMDETDPSKDPDIQRYKSVLRDLMNRAPVGGAKTSRTGAKPSLVQTANTRLEDALKSPVK